MARALGRIARPAARPAAADRAGDVRRADEARTQAVLTEHDDAWVDQQEEILWIDKGRGFPLAQREGRLATRLPRGARRQASDPGHAGEFDVTRVLAVDPNGDWLYFQASPDDPTRRYLFRVKLDGTGLDRVTPGTSRGRTSIRSRQREVAIHRFRRPTHHRPSTSSTCPVTSVCDP